MILYDEFGQLLGADKESLELFGCGNITEFKEKVSDISDFFINKEGYIHKFDHYNWIDFLNYSEEKIDKVLIRQEDNSVVEAKVTVREIYNLIEINGSKTTYMIDFIDQNILPLESELQIIAEENDANKTLEEVQENTQENKTDNETEIIEQGLLEEKIEIDYSNMEKEYDVGKELYLELLNDFIIESKNDLDLMRAYILNSNYESLLKITDKLKSICTNLKLKLFLPILNAMERNVRNKSYNNIEKFLNLYKKELHILSENIRQI